MCFEDEALVKMTKFNKNIKMSTDELLLKLKRETELLWLKTPHTKEQNHASKKKIKNVPPEK